MGLMAKLISFARTVRNGANVSDVKSDPGGRAVQTSEHFSTPGTDAHPLPGDFVLLASIQGTGRYGAAGYVDPKNQQLAESGEHRTYARDANGDQIAQVWLKNDGTILIEANNGAISWELKPDKTGRLDNGSGFIELKASGVLDLNGLTISPAGEAVSPVGFSGPSIKAAGKELGGHDHPINSGSSAPGPTGPNN